MATLQMEATVAEDIVAREVLVDFLYQGHLQYHLYGSVSAYDRADTMIRDLAAEGVAVVAAAEIERLRAEVARFQENSAARAEREADYRRVITELEDEIAKQRGERFRLVKRIASMTPAGLNPEDDADTLNSLIGRACDILGEEPLAANAYDDEGEI